MTDPINNRSPQTRALFETMSAACNGFSSEDAINAAANVIINALRQACPTRAGAMLALDEVVASTKNVLSDHYTSAGRKKGVFPYHQTISVPLIDFSKTDPFIKN